MKTLFLLPLSSTVVTRLPSDVSARLKLPEFLHGPLIIQKNVSVTDLISDKRERQNAHRGTANIQSTESDALTKTAKIQRGRPRSIIDVKAAFNMQKDGLTIKEICRQLNCSQRCLERALANFKRKRWEF